LINMRAFTERKGPVEYRLLMQTIDHQTSQKFMRIRQSQRPYSFNVQGRVSDGRQIKEQPRTRQNGIQIAEYDFCTMPGLVQ